MQIKIVLAWGRSCLVDDPAQVVVDDLGNVVRKDEGQKQPAVIVPGFGYNREVPQCPGARRILQGVGQAQVGRKEGAFDEQTHSVDPKVHIELVIRVGV